MRTFVAIALAAVVGMLTLWADYSLVFPRRQKFAVFAVAIFAALIALAMALRFVAPWISN